MSIAVDEIFLIDSDSHLFGYCILKESFTFGVLVGEDDLTIEAIFIGDDLVGLALIEFKFSFAFCSFFSVYELFLWFCGFGLGFAFEEIIAEELAEGEMLTVFWEWEFWGGEGALFFWFAFIVFALFGLFFDE